MLWDGMTITKATISGGGAALQPGATSPWRRGFLVLGCWIAALSLGAVHTWAARHSMNADGMSYLDLADAWRTGRWADAVNAYWSPLYPWVLAMALHLAKPGGYWEAAVAHLVNFVGYGFSLVCFHYFWMGLERHVSARRQSAGNTGKTAFPQWAWVALGYALCVWILLDWVTVDQVTPDLYVAGWVFLDAGILVRIRDGKARILLFILLGISLGLGYLTKAILLPMAAVFLATAFLASPRKLRAIPPLMLTTVMFAALGGPWAYALSKAKGRFTLGDAGKLNYAFIVNGFKPWDVWQGEPPPPGRGDTATHGIAQAADRSNRVSTAKHPARWLLDGPHVFEFASPRAGTYSLWYDPAYWHEGAEPRFDLRQQVRVCAQQLAVYFSLFCRDQGPISFVLLCLLLVRGRWASIIGDVLSLWWLALPAIAGLAAYAMVKVEARYVAPFVILLWAVVLPLVRLEQTEATGRLIRCAAAAILIALILTVGYNSAPAIREAVTDLRERHESCPNWHWRVAQEMSRAGLHPGDHVGHVGQALKSWSYWARLAGVRITAELRPWESFWLGDDAARKRALGAFAAAGVKAVVTRKQEVCERPFGLPYDFAPGWRPVGNTGFYIRFLDEAASAPSSQPATEPAG